MARIDTTVETSPDDSRWASASGVGRLVHHPQRHVAAENAPGVALQPRHHRGRDRSDSRNGGNAQGEAREEDAKSLEPVRSSRRARRRASGPVRMIYSAA
ncbi:MAG: hypothetical protein ACMVO3_00980 [Thalassobaculum sp.]